MRKQPKNQMKKNGRKIIKNRGTLSKFFRSIFRNYLEGQYIGSIYQKLKKTENLIFDFFHRSPRALRPY